MPLLFKIITSIYRKDLVRNVFQEDHSKVCHPCFQRLDRISLERNEDIFPTKKILYSQLLLWAQFVVSQLLRGTQNSLVDIPLGDSRHDEQDAMRSLGMGR